MTRRLIGWRVRWESCGADGVWREICEEWSTVGERYARADAASLRRRRVGVCNVRLLKVWRSGR